MAGALILGVLVIFVHVAHGHNGHDHNSAVAPLFTKHEIVSDVVNVAPTKELIVRNVFFLSK